MARNYYDRDFDRNRDHDREMRDRRYRSDNDFEMRNRDFDNDPRWTDRGNDRSWTNESYRDYGWESGQSALPEWRDRTVRDRSGPMSDRDFQDRNRGVDRDFDRGLGNDREYRMRDRNRDYGYNRDYGMQDRNRDYGYNRDYGMQDRNRDYGYNRDYGMQDRNRDFGSRRDSGRNRGFQQSEPTWSYTELWLIPGPATGRGPEGYQRSNESIKEEACERLTRHGRLDARNIRMDVEDGEITLEGTVRNRREKRMAEDALESLSGVRDIHNRLTVEEREDDDNIFEEALDELDELA